MSSFFRPHFRSYLSPKASRRKRTLWLASIALLLVLLFAWGPCDQSLLFRALPETALLRSTHRNLASGYHALVRNPLLLNALQQAGVDEAESLADETEGFYQTLFWLTGSRTTLALSLSNDPLTASLHPADPASLRPLLQLPPDLLLPRLRVSGASYVGWKRRPMEFLWRIRYVPGLGRLDTTERGTRYLVFRHSKQLRRNGLVLSLDMVKGHLLAVLSTDPDAVCELVQRVSTPPVPDSTTPTFPAPAHALTFFPQSPHSTTLYFNTPKDPNRLALRLAQGPIRTEPLPKLAPPTERPPILANIALRNPPASTPVTLLAYGEPNPSTFCGFTIPGLVAFLPPDGPNPHEQLQTTLTTAFGPDAKAPILTNLDANLSLVDFRPFFGKHAIIKPAQEEQPFLFRPTAPDQHAVLGSCLASYQRLAADPTPLSNILAQNTQLWTDPSLAASGWINLNQTANALRNVTAILNLASSFVPDLAPLRSSIETINRGLLAAATLHSIDFTLRTEPTPCLDALLSREP